METNRWKATVVLSSDHAGINVELGKFEAALLRAIARIDDPRKLRDLMCELRTAAASWCMQNQVDMSGWMERTRKVRA